MQKKDIVIHIILLIFTCGIGNIIYYLMTRNKKVKSSIPQQSVSKNLPIISIDFNVSGITFEDRQEKIKKSLRNAFSNEILYKYNGKTNKEIKDWGDTVFEADDVLVDELKLIPTKYNGKDAIEVHIADFTDNDIDIMVGYVPQKNIKEVLQYLDIKKEHPEYKVIQDGFIRGGKGKSPREDGIVDVELNYGIEVSLALYKNNEIQ